MGCSRSRRQVLLGAGASLGALAVPVSARAQAAMGGDPLSQLLGRVLPPQLRAVLPGEAFEAAEFVAGIARLESQAKLLRLPMSPLSVGEAPVSADLDRLYEMALPRLVALIDRAELREIGLAEQGLAEQAGALLARLHDTQHVIPASLGGFALALPGTSPGTGTNSGALRLDPGADSTAPAPDISLPDAADEAPPGADPDPVGEPVPTPEPAPVLAPIRISRSLRFADIAAEYAQMFAAAAVRPAHAPSARWHLAMMRQSKARYSAVGDRSGVPWYFIAAIHGLEASFNFRAHYHNGDHPLSQRTRQVPAGRPSVWLPPSSWEASAADALRLMGFAGAKDWSLARTLYRLEAFNGFGYRRLGRVSPYLWSFSTLYERGKFVADGRFSAAARSQQCGTAVMLKLLADEGEIELA